MIGVDCHTQPKKIKNKSRVQSLKQDFKSLNEV
jgi:hypothetical protein